MRTNRFFNNAILILAIIGLVGVSANSVFSQQVKKKMVRVIENDGKGEKIVKEYDITNNERKLDSIKRNVHKKMKVEQKKIDSLERVLMISLPHHIEVPPIPELPDMPDIYVDAPDAPFFEWHNGEDFDWFAPSSEKSSAKVYYSEKDLDKSGNLEKILEDLENGTFDAQKWSMKEVEKDKIKEFKTKGKGQVIILNNHSTAPRRVRINNMSPRRNNARNHVEVRKSQKGDGIIFIDSDSLSKKDFETYSFFSSGDSDEEGLRKVIMKRDADWDEKHSINGHHIAYYSFDSDKDSSEENISKSFHFESTDDSDEPNCEKVMVVTSNGHKHDVFMKSDKDIRKVAHIDNSKATFFEFSNPTAEDYKTLEKSSLQKEDKAKLLSPSSLILLPKKDKYTVSFKEKESGKVKFIITDDKGKTIKTEEFEHSGGKTEKDIEIKDLKSGVYYIQVQLNNKTTTSRLKVTKD